MLKERGISHLAVDELDVMRTLSVTVSSSVTGTSLVPGVLGKTTILVHLDEVQGTVQATGQARDINVELTTVSRRYSKQQI